MTTACTTSEYFSGQGAVLVATRDVNGDPEGFRPVGNVSALTISIEVTEFEHKESCSGVRGIDLTITQETNPTLTMTLESLSKENLALALFGTASAIAASAATDEVVTAKLDLWVPLEFLDIDTVVVQDVTDTTTYTLDTDYVLNTDAGTIMALSTGTISEDDVLHIDYNYGAQEEIQALTTSSPASVALRFEGLNTANSDSPVVVNIHSVKAQPLAELALINDEIASMEVTAKILLDATKPDGEQYFEVKKT